MRSRLAGICGGPQEFPAFHQIDEPQDVASLREEMLKKVPRHPMASRTHQSNVRKLIAKLFGEQTTNTTRLLIRRPSISCFQMSVAYLSSDYLATNCSRSAILSVRLPAVKIKIER